MLNNFSLIVVQKQLYTFGDSKTNSLAKTYESKPET
jgi:ribosomal protein S24E